MSKHIPENIIQEVLEKADIESVVGKYVVFTKRTGNNLFGLCPFHSEKSPSFSVNPMRNTYKCFGCNKGGNSIGFIMEIENLSFPDAVRFLAKDYGIEIPETDDYRSDISKKQKERTIALLTDAARFFYKCLQSDMGKPARDYAARRKLSTSTLRSFGMGYAPDSWDSLYKELSAKGYTDEEMERSGIFTKTKNTGKIIDFFRNKLMFPIFDTFGNIIAFGGRVLDDSKPKYLNSPETEVFKKQENLFALNFAKKYCKERLIVVEGYMDAISMHQAGIKNTVASLGTAFTASHMNVVSKCTEEVVFFFDADQAGKTAALRSLGMILPFIKKRSGMHLRVKVCAVPEGKDPDEFIKEFGADRFLDVVKSAKDYDDYLFERAYDDSNINDVFDRNRFQEDVIRYGSWIPDEIKRYRFASRANSYLAATPDILMNAMDSYTEADKKVEERSIERSRNEDIERRKSLNGQQAYEGGVAPDYASPLELEVFAFAVSLRGKLIDPSYVEQQDIIRPSDFYGENMQKICGFFLKNFKKDVGVRDDILVQFMSDMTINGAQAEIVYLDAADKLPVGLSSDKRVREYLIRLNRMRRDMLKKKRNDLAALYDSDAALSEEQRAGILNSIAKIDAGLDYLRGQEGRF